MPDGWQQQTDRISGWEIVEEVRKNAAWVLTVGRTVGGAYEYVTPEMCVPEKSLRVPWESCLTLGADFNYAYGDHYKSREELVKSSGQYCEGRKYGVKCKSAA